MFFFPQIYSVPGGQECYDIITSDGVSSGAQCDSAGAALGSDTGGSGASGGSLEERNCGKNSQEAEGETV